MIFRAFTTISESLRSAAFIFPLFCLSMIACAPAFAEGGGDSGGGSGIWEGGKLHLRDFARCPAARKLKVTEPMPVPTKISGRISKLSSTELRDWIKKNAPIANESLSQLVAVSTARANWYVVKDHFELPQDPGLKLALFKRPIGTLLDQEYLDLLPAPDRLGLAIHESLRMASIGLGHSLKDSELEELTCKIILGQKIEGTKLKEFLGNSSFNVCSENDGQMRAARATNEFLANLEDVRGRLAGENAVYFFQADVSKFETLRRAAPGLSEKHFEDAFFAWAGREAPKDCSSTEKCAYAEEWPVDDDSDAALEKWNLDYLDASAQGWSAGSFRFYVPTKEAASPSEAAQQCRDISRTSRRSLELASYQDLEKLKTHQGFRFVASRKNLSSIESEERVFLATRAGKHVLWGADDSEFGYRVISPSYTSSGHAFCVER